MHYYYLLIENILFCFPRTPSNQIHSLKFRFFTPKYPEIHSMPTLCQEKALETAAMGIFFDTQIGSI